MLLFVFMNQFLDRNLAQLLPILPVLTGPSGYRIKYPRVHRSGPAKPNVEGNVAIRLYEPVFGQESCSNAAKSSCTHWPFGYII